MNNKDMKRGVSRNIDGLGRICIPKNMRKAMDLSEGDAVSITLFAEGILLKREVALCPFCKKSKNLQSFRSGVICKSCLKELVDSSTSQT